VVQIHSPRPLPSLNPTSYARQKSKRPPGKMPSAIIASGSCKLSRILRLRAGGWRAPPENLSNNLLLSLVLADCSDWYCICDGEKCASHQRLCVPSPAALMDRAVLKQRWSFVVHRPGAPDGMIPTCKCLGHSGAKFSRKTTSKDIKEGEHKKGDIVTEVQHEPPRLKGPMQRQKLGELVNEET